MPTAKKEKIKPLRTIYDQNYYRAQAMLRDPWFIEKIAWLKKRFTDTGCPLPAKPFKKYQEYFDWNDKFWQRYAEMQKSPEFLAEKQRITGGKEEMSWEAFYELEDFKDKFLPPVYGETYKEILEHFNIDPKHRGFRDFLEFYIFFGKNEFRTQALSASWRTNSRTDETEFLLKINGFTKKEDLLDWWDWIAEQQKSMKDYIGRNKAWVTFDRDVEIYNHYKELKKSEFPRRGGLDGMNGIMALDKDIWADLNEKYPRLTIGNIRRIISQTAMRLGEQ